MVDEEKEGGREEGGRGEEEQRVPEDSGVVLHPISEDSSMYPEPRSTDLLAPNQYVGKKYMYINLHVYSGTSI